MHSHPNMLLHMRQLVKLYDSYLEEIRKKHHLTQIEVTIISFLNNNPGKDTARDISALRMIPKGNVSQGVESLIQKKYLTRTIDEEDRRKIHLSIRKEARPIVEEIETTKIHFRDSLLDGFTEEEIILLEDLNGRMFTNALKIIEGK